MLKIFIILTLTIVFFSAQVASLKAQFQTDSNTVITRVGNPATQASCPIPNGISYCGSKANPYRGCGHCGAGYEAFSCAYDSLQYAMDVAGQYGQNVLLPEINRQKVKWTWIDQQLKRDRITSIQRYSGINESTGEQYWIQFHHTAPGSGGGTKMSGEVGARICSIGCDVGTGPHVHIEFATITDAGQKVWTDATTYFCPQ